MSVRRLFERVRDRLEREPVLVGTAVLGAVFDVAAVLRFDLPFTEAAGVQMLTVLAGLVMRRKVSPVTVRKIRITGSEVSA